MGPYYYPATVVAVEVVVRLRTSTGGLAKKMYVCMYVQHSIDPAIVQHYM